MIDIQKVADEADLIVTGNVFEITVKRAFLEKNQNRRTSFEFCNKGEARPC